MITATGVLCYKMENDVYFLRGDKLLTSQNTNDNFTE